MTGWCPSCGARNRVPNTRGSRLSHHHCIKCGRSGLVGSQRAKRLGIIKESWDAIGQPIKQEDDK